MPGHTADLKIRMKNLVFSLINIIMKAIYTTLQKKLLNKELRKECLKKILTALCLLILPTIPMSIFATLARRLFYAEMELPFTLLKTFISQSRSMTITNLTNQLL